MKLVQTAFAAASLFALAQPAAAQQAQAPSATQMAPVSDAELENFIVAASMIQQVQRNSEMAKADKDKAAMQVLSQAEMTPQRFNRIGAALQSDTQLQARADKTISRLRAEAQG